MFTKRSKREKEISNTTFLYVQNIHNSFNMILFKAKRKLACNKTDVTMGQTDQRKKYETLSIRYSNTNMRMPLFCHQRQPRGHFWGQHR